MPPSPVRSTLIPVLALATVLAFASLGSVLFGFSFLYAVSVTLFLGAAYLLFQSPLALLLVLIVVRMSLDYFGETVSLSLTDTVSVTLSQLIGLGVAALGTLLFIANSRARAAIPRLWPLIIVILWGMASLAVSIAPDVTARELLRVFDIAAVAALAYAGVRTRRDYARLLGAVFLSSIVPIALGLYQFATGIGFQDDAVSIPRIFGTFSHPNVFSLYLFVLIATTALAATRIRRATPVPVIALLALGTVFSATLLLTYTRVAWIILFVFLCVIGLVRFRALLVPLIAFPLLLYLFVLPIQERVDSIFHADPGSSVSWRQSLWSATMDRTLSEGRVATGFGMGTFYDVSGQLYDPTIGQNEAHNDFVKFFVEGGILGLFVYLAYGLGILWPLFRRGVLLPARLRGTHDEPADAAASLILFALAFSLALASLSDNVFKNTPVEWVLWALLAATWSILPQEKKKTAGLR